MQADPERAVEWGPERARHPLLRRPSDRDPPRAPGGRPRARPSHAAGVRDRAPPDLGGVDDRDLDGRARRSTEARFCTRAEPGCSSETRGTARARRSGGWPRPACRSSPTISSCATGTTCSPARAASTLRLEPARQLNAGRDLGVVGTRERWRVDVPHCPPSAPLRGWIFLEWGPEIAVQRLSPVERMSRLAQHRAIAVPWDDPVTLLDLAARPAFVWSRPKGWRNVERVNRYASRTNRRRVGRQGRQYNDRPGRGPARHQLPRACLWQRTTRRFGFGNTGSTGARSMARWWCSMSSARTTSI